MMKHFRSWLASVAGALAGKAADGETGIVSMFGGQPISKLQDFADYLDAGTSKVWATWKSCDLVSQVVMDTPFKLSRGTQTEPAKVPDLERLLSYANESMSFAELLYVSAMHYKMTGNAFWYKAGANLNGDKPRELYSLNPKRMKVVPDDRGKVTGYLLQRNGIDVPFDPEEIIHFRRPHANNDFLGQGEMEAGEAILNEAINRDVWADKYWSNGASPSGVLMLKERITDDAELQRAKAKWKAEYGGKENAGKTAWLTGDWTYQQLGLSGRDMQDLEKQRWSLEQIFMLHGIPLSVAGLKDAANFATASIDDQRFRQYAVKPVCKAFEDAINTDLVAGWDARLKFTFDVSGLVNFAQVADAVTLAFDRGLLSINEARAKLGLSTDPDNVLFGQHYINAGLVPLDLAGVAAQDTTDDAAKAIVSRFTGQITDRNASRS